MTENHRACGSRYEEMAAAFLTGQGYRMLEHSYSVRGGEIDLIARDGAVLVFIEVKYRKNDRFGHPEEAVTARKQQRIRLAARTYLMKHHLPEDTPCRFDVAAIEGNEIRLYKDAFGG